MRRSKKMVPGVDGLEQRQLLTHYYQLGTMGPFLTPTAFYSDGMMPPPPPPPDPGTAPDPQVMVSGPSMDAVGGRFMAGVMAPAGLALKSVGYSVSGPGIVVKANSQTWTVPESSYETTTGEAHAFKGPTYPTIDGWNAYWGPTDGTYTIKVSVTYADGRSASSTTNVQVNPVRVTSLTAYDRPMTFAKYNSSNIGFFHPDGSNSATFSAKVDSVPADGVMGFVQEVTVFDRWTFSDGTVKTTYVPGGDQILDQLTEASTPFIYDTTFQVSQSDGPVMLGGGGTRVIGDNPRLTTLTAQPGDTVFCTKLEMERQFITYLVYHPNDGVYIAVARVTWNESGTATYIGPTDIGGAVACTPDPTYWSYTVSPSQYTTTAGSIVASILTWPDSIYHARPGYTTGKAPWDDNPDDSLLFLPDTF